MVLTDIFSRFLKKETPQETNFLSLSIAPDRVLASVWALEGEKVEVLGFARKSFQNVDSIIHQSAVAIDDAAEKAKSDVSQVVFGLSSSWFDGPKIKKDTTKLLKKLSQELELDVQAFVPIASAIKNYLKFEEGITPHAVLVGIFSDSFEVYLLKNNEVEKTLNSKSKPTLEKISALVKQLGEDKDLPAKIIVFGIPDDSRLADEIGKYEWKGTFVSKPKVQFLKNREVSKSVAFAQATDVLGHELSTTEALGTLAPIGIEDVEIKKAVPEPDELGFIEGEDILKKNEVSASGETSGPQSREELAVEVDENVKAAEPTAVELEPEQKAKAKGSLVENMATLAWVSKLLNIFKGPGLVKKIGIGLGAFVALAFVGTLIAGRFITSAEVVIKVNAKSQEENFDIDAIVGASSDFTRQQINGQEIVGEASGSRKAVTTGTKELGESAKGEITVLNWTDEEASFDKDTVVITKNGIQFALDSEIKIASRAAKDPGEKNVTVTAIDLGPEGNIGASSEFTFTQYDKFSFSAVNDNAFSGGDEKKVTVVSQEDLDKLEESLLESLKQNATSNLKEKLAGKTFSESTIEVEIVKKVFDKKLEEESSLVNLDMSVEATAIAYSEEELKKLLAENVKDDAPENLEAKAEDIKLLNVDATGTTRGLNLTGSFEAKFIPKFDENELREKVMGKSVKETRETIKGLPEVVDVNVNFSPSFFFTNSLPTSKEKISFKVES